MNRTEKARQHTCFRRGSKVITCRRSYTLTHSLPLNPHPNNIPLLMSIASMDSFSSISDLEYTDSELSSGTISLGELCIAEKKQMVLRDAPFRVGSAEKVGSWLDKLYMARTLLLAPEVQNKRVDEGISVLNVHGGAKQGLPSSPDEMDCCSIQQLDMAGRPNGITTSKNDVSLAFADRRDSGKPVTAHQNTVLTSGIKILRPFRCASCCPTRPSQCAESSQASHNGVPQSYFATTRGSPSTTRVGEAPSANS